MKIRVIVYDSEMHNSCQAVLPNFIIYAIKSFRSKTLRTSIQRIVDSNFRRLIIAWIHSELSHNYVYCKMKFVRSRKFLANWLTTRFDVLIKCNLA